MTKQKISLVLQGSLSFMKFIFVGCFSIRLDYIKLYHKNSACRLRHGQRSRFTSTFKYKRKQKTKQKKEKKKRTRTKLSPELSDYNRGADPRPRLILEPIMVIAGPKASNQMFSGGRRQTTCLFFFLIGGLLTSCILSLSFVFLFFRSQRFHSTAKQTSCSVSCLFSEPICF